MGHSTNVSPAEGERGYEKVTNRDKGWCGGSQTVTDTGEKPNTPILSKSWT